MVNLISSTTRRKLTTLYYARLVTATSVALGSVVLIGTVLLLPSYFFINAEVDQASRYVASAEGIANQRAKGAAPETLAAFNEATRFLNTTAREPSFAHIMILAVEDKLLGISVSNVAVTYDDGGVATVRLTGTATTRAVLIAFSNQLKKVAEFKNVTIPVSDLVSDTDGPFSISLQWHPTPRP